MLTFAFIHHPYLVHILFGMPSLHLFDVFKSCYDIYIDFNRRLKQVNRGRLRKARTPQGWACHEGVHAARVHARAQIVHSYMYTYT